MTLALLVLIALLGWVARRCLLDAAWRCVENRDAAIRQFEREKDPADAASVRE